MLIFNRDDDSMGATNLIPNIFSEDKVKKEKLVICL